MLKVNIFVLGRKTANKNIEVTMEVLSDDGKVLEVREIQFHVLIFGIIYRESIRFCSIL